MKTATRRYNRRWKTSNKVRRARVIHNIKGWGEDGIKDG